MSPCLRQGSPGVRNGLSIAGRDTKFEILVAVVLAFRSNQFLGPAPAKDEATVPGLASVPSLRRTSSTLGCRGCRSMISYFSGMKQMLLDGG
jgi:hypothetical protein